jgi:nicotinate-nucleotide adenylyltransferase
MTEPVRVGVLGGTFDPIHLGHLAAARIAQDTLRLTSLRFIPSHRPPHRPGAPQASGAARLAMIELSIAGNHGWQASDLELRRQGPSYTYDTLAALHAEGLKASQLFFIVGADAFAEIRTWSRYPAVLDLAHFVVIARQGTALERIPQQVPEIAPRLVRADALAEGTTLVEGTPSGVPARLGVPLSTRVVFIEADTPDVSSTMVRERARRGEDLDGLVTRNVADYIDRHGLYRVAERQRSKVESSKGVTS